MTKTERLLKQALTDLLDAIPAEVLREHAIVSYDIYGIRCDSQGTRQFPKLQERAMVARDIVLHIGETQNESR